MGILAWIVFGFVVGLVARALMPGSQKLGFIKTTLLGVVGSFVGGTLGNLIAGNGLERLSSGGFVGSVVGALLFMVVVGFLRRR